MSNNHSHSKIRKLLTKLYKKRIVYLEDSVSLVWLKKKFRSIRKAIVGSSSKFFSKPALIGKTRSHKMKKFIVSALSSQRKLRSSVVSVFAIGLVATVLAACGGGGGGNAGSVGTSTSVVCSDRTNAPTESQCPGVNISTVKVTFNGGQTLKNATTVPVDAVITVETPNNTLRTQSQDALVVSAGASIAQGRVSTSTVDFKSFTWTSTPGKPMNYSQAYNLTVKGVDNDGKQFDMVIPFTTSVTALTCPPPAMANSLGTCMSPPVANAIWNSAMKAWAYPAGVLVVGLNTLPAACVTIGDACWIAKIADGTIKLVSTNAAMTGYSTRPAVFAVYKTFDGYNNEMALYADVPALGTAAGQLVFNGGGMQTVTDVKGSDNGIKITYPDFGCYERVHTGGGGWGNVKLNSCPI